MLDASHASCVEADIPTVRIGRWGHEPGASPEDAETAARDDHACNGATPEGCAGCPLRTARMARLSPGHTPGGAAARPTSLREISK